MGPRVRSRWAKGEMNLATTRVAVVAAGNRVVHNDSLMLVEVRDMRDDSFRLIFPKFSRWLEIGANEMYALPCLSLEDFKKLFGNKVRPLPDDAFKSYLQNLSNEELEELRDAMARNIAPGNERIYR